jgi:hypothetical protein
MQDNFYTLKQLETCGFTDIKYRMIKNRFNELIESDEIRVGNKVYKERNRWYIHYSIIGKFQAKRKLKSHRKVPYENEITINLKDNYNAEYYHLLGYYILKFLNPYSTLYRVEACVKTEGYHIHLATNAVVEDIFHALTLLEDRLQIRIVNNSNTHVSKILDLSAFLDYINKAVVY